jgi:hypothetical protein
MDDERQGEDDEEVSVHFLGFYAERLLQVARVEGSP